MRERSKRFQEEVRRPKLLQRCERTRCHGKAKGKFIVRGGADEVKAKQVMIRESFRV